MASRMNRFRRLIVLGAGASYAAGLPDANHILGDLQFFMSGPINRIVNRTPMVLFSDVASVFQGLIIDYMYDQELNTASQFPLDTILERFYERTKNDIRCLPTQISMWRAIREYIYHRSWVCADAYIPFASRLRDGDVLVSFNWDLCVEMAMHRIGRRTDVRFCCPSRILPSLFKPHGSVDFLAVQPDRGGGGDPDGEFSEIVHPALPKVSSPLGEFEAALMRLRTYDLPWRLEASWNFSTDTFSLATNKVPEELPHYTNGDIGPLHLERHWNECWPFLLTPGWSPPFYEWAYHGIESAVTPIAEEIASVHVVGYSFPPYDAGAHTFLRSLSQQIGNVPVHIVNPTAHSLPRALLNHIFGEVTLHPTGFLEYPWST
jgi:hypothetical protein